MSAGSSPTERPGARPAPPGGPPPGAQAPRPRFLRRRRAEAAAALAPLAALFLLMPPFIGVFAHDGRIFGAPMVLIFLLVVWMGLILVSRRLARSLLTRDGEL